MDTRTKILHAALALFSQRGFGAVSVEEIAAAVGIKAPSLYKHYKGKRDIFQACAQEFSARMNGRQAQIGLPGSAAPAFSYETVALEQFLGVADSLLEFYLTDEVASKFRRILMIERYHDAELDALFKSIFIDGAIDSMEEVFTGLLKAGVFKGASAHCLALQFYAPIFYLLQKYDMRPEELEEAQAELNESIEGFCRAYGNPTKGTKSK